MQYQNQAPATIEGLIRKVFEGRRPLQLRTCVRR